PPARMLGAADPDRGDGHAVDADGPPALGAGQPSLPIRVPVAVPRVSHRVSVPAAMRVHVAFTPAEEVGARVGIVVDVLRATSTICQALASGYGRVLCCAEIDQAREVAAREGTAVFAGGRKTVRIEGV